ncbi:MAG: hypothetical protein A2Y10_04050 [Planctomycetes bacterium GWF2_41_51]|nr:MAG: hypothetical protein A2Y10_04050 [Planctomycetes bacterium GWF2_41_51]HBG26503.1 hypothetical protein [Phycisphaerales bacterium]
MGKKKLFRAGVSLLAILLFPLLANAVVWDSHWGGPGYGVWSGIYNWDYGPPNNNPAIEYYFNVFIPGSADVEVDGAYTVNTVNISESAGFISIGSDTVGNKSLTLAGGTNNVNGRISIDDAPGTYTATLNIAGDSLMQGTGSIDFVTTGYNYLNGAATLTIGSGFTLQANSGGSGIVNVANIINNGTIRSNGGTLNLNENITNNNLIAAQSGTLNLDTMTLNNTNGTLSASSGANFNINNCTIESGLLTDGTFNIEGTLNVFNNVTIDDDATVALGGTYNEYLKFNNITNNGQIRLIDNPGVYIAALQCNGAANIDGSGEIVFATGGGYNRITYANSSAADSITIGENQTIRTENGATGDIWLDVINNGIISADNGTITIYENVENNNQLRSINGGTVNLSTMTADNTGGQISVDSGSSFNISNSTIAGGTLTGGGTFSIDGTTSFFDNVELDQDTAIAIGGATSENLKVNSIENNGQIRLMDNPGTYAAILNCDGAVNLSGTGEVVFATAGYNWIQKANTSGDSLTIGENQTVRTESGASGEIYLDVINNGIISADSGTITIKEDVENNNQLRSINGSTIKLETMTLNNASGQLYADSSSGFTVHGSIINGGNLTGGTFNIDSTTSRFNNVTVGENTSVSFGGATTESLYLQNNITNNGQIRLSDDPGYYTASLYCDGAVNLGGTGEVLLATGGYNYIDKVHTTGDILTIGQNQTIKTTTGGIGNIRVETINNGTIAADGGMLTIENNVSGSGRWRADGGTIHIYRKNVSTTGDVALVNGGKLQLSSSSTNFNMQTNDLYIDSTSQIEIDGILTILDDLITAQTDEADWIFTSDSTLQMKGGIAAVTENFGNWGSLEIAGLDNGEVSEGYVNNFSLPNLVIGENAHIYLADLMDNGNRNGFVGFNEALYVDTLVFADGLGTLNLNGLNIYYNTLVGSQEQIINVVVPEPATIVLLSLGALSLLRKNKYILHNVNSHDFKSAQ